MTGEFYQAGVRPLNSMKPPTHPNLDDDKSHHLGHVHVACKRTAQAVSDKFEVYISGWDDANWGKSILEKVKSCHLTPSKWQYVPKDDFTFGDGTKSQNWASWNMVWSYGGCAESKIEEAMGLRGGGLNCAGGKFEELDMFK
jgi:hypothetical protein